MSSHASNVPPGSLYDPHAPWNQTEAQPINCEECDGEIIFDGVEDQDYFIRDGYRICRNCYFATKCECGDPKNPQDEYCAECAREAAGL